MPCVGCSGLALDSWRIILATPRAVGEKEYKEKEATGREGEEDLEYEPEPKAPSGYCSWQWQWKRVAASSESLVCVSPAVG